MAMTYWSELMFTNKRPDVVKPLDKWEEGYAQMQYALTGLLTLQDKRVNITSIPTLYICSNCGVANDYWPSLCQPCDATNDTEQDDYKYGQSI